MKYKGQGAQLHGPYNGNKDGQDSENADMHGAIMNSRMTIHVNSRLRNNL